MILFDELGLAERAKTNPLKFLHSKLEYKGKADGISFVGISNYTLDVDKINRILKLSVPDLENNMKWYNRNININCNKCQWKIL